MRRLTCHLPMLPWSIVGLMLGILSCVTARAAGVAEKAVWAGDTPA
jgi:hypothetical protein